MIISDGKYVQCDIPGCNSKIPNHRWGKTKSGWFFATNGRAFCKSHIPPWADSWRAKRERR